jgi:Lipoprotein LpqB beta-propeller domain
MIDRAATPLRPRVRGTERSLVGSRRHSGGHSLSDRPARFGRRRAAWAAAIGGVVLLVGSACGVPSSGPPVADSTVSDNSGSGGGGFGQSLPTPTSEGTESPVGFTEAYLGTLAGATTQDGALELARAFIAPEQRRGLSGGPITVVRQISDLTDTPKQEQSASLPSDEVSGRFQVIGVYKPETGELDPPSDTKTTMTLTFDTAPVDTRTDIGDRPNDSTSGILQFTKVPQMMLMSETALQKYFTPHPIYFWDSTTQALIADLRYLPTGLSPILQATKIVNWVLGGPSAWIISAAPPQGNAALVDPTVRVDRNGTYVVNLNSDAQRSTTPGRLAYELQWSLGRLLADPTSDVIPSPVKIEVEGQPLTNSGGTTNFRENVPNLALPRASNTASTYAIANGVVTQISVDTSAGVTTQAGTNETPHVLNSPKNSNVVLAAVNGSATAAALVRTDSRGRESLWIRRASATNAGNFVEITKGLPAGTMTRPQFVTQPTDAVIVAVNGRLYRIDSRNQVRQIQLPPGVTSVSAFSVAADAHRIALIAGGSLYFSVITNGDSPSVENILPIVIAPALDTATAVSWSSVDQLLVAGMKGRIAQLAEMNIDGSVEPTEFVQAYSGAITMVTSYSYDPLYPSYFDDLMVQTSNGAYAGRRPSPLKIVNGAKSTPLSAPFFED